MRLRLLLLTLILPVSSFVLRNTGSSISGPFQLGATPGTDVLTYRNDAGRTGQNLAETTLTPSNVNASSFGKLRSIAVDGNVDAQPLYVSQISMGSLGTRSVIFAATEHDSVYAIDANSGAVLWRAGLTGAGETASDDRGCYQVSPEIGATATPVIDLTAGAHGTIYVLGMTKDASGNYHHRLHALDVTTGVEEFGGPTEVAAAVSSSGPNSTNNQVVFDPKQYKSRPGMLLLNNVIYTGWGSHCDRTPYNGWLIGYNESTLKQEGVFNFAPNGTDAALWAAGGGVAGDTATGGIFVSVANGTFDSTLNASGFPNGGDYGNAFVRLNLSGGKLAAEDYWTMDNTVAESDIDEDLGSGGLILLPELKTSSGSMVQLGTGAGKDATIYLFNRANMGKFDAQNDSTLYQQVSGALGGPVFSSPAWFNGMLYYGAAGDHIRAFKLTNAFIQSPAAAMTGTSFGFPGTTPAISANGANSGILWALEYAATGVLHAYNASNVAVELYNSSQAGGARDQFGPALKYVTPTVADGRVIVGAAHAVVVYGLLSRAQTINFGVIPAQAIGGSISLSASATSGLPVSYYTPTGRVCSVSGSKVSFLAAGTCKVTATQAGNGSFASAPAVSQEFTVRAAQTISFGAIATHTVGSSLVVTASASSGGPVSFYSPTGRVCTVSGSTVSCIGAGTCKVTATQAGTGTYAPVAVSQEFTVR